MLQGLETEPSPKPEPVWKTSSQSLSSSGRTPQRMLAKSSLYFQSSLTARRLGNCSISQKFMQLTAGMFSGQKLACSTETRLCYQVPRHRRTERWTVRAVKLNVPAWNRCLFNNWMSYYWDDFTSFHASHCESWCGRSVNDRVLCIVNEVRMRQTATNIK